MIGGRGMPSPATLSKLMVMSLLGGLALLLVEIRFEHREALGEAWQSWIPPFYCGSMLALGAFALARWHRGGRQVVLVGFAGAFLIGLLGFWFHIKGQSGVAEGHSHNVIVSAAQLSSIGAGQTVQVKSGSAGGHTHLFTFLKLA